MTAALSACHRVPPFCSSVTPRVLSISPQHRGSDAASVCAANRQHGVPELPAHRAGAVAPHERWEKDSKGIDGGSRR